MTAMPSIFCKHPVTRRVLFLCQGGDANDKQLVGQQRIPFYPHSQRTAFELQTISAGGAALRFDARQDAAIVCKRLKRCRWAGLHTLHSRKYLSPAALRTR